MVFRNCFKYVHVLYTLHRIFFAHTKKLLSNENFSIKYISFETLKNVEIWRGLKKILRYGNPIIFSFTCFQRVKKFNQFKISYRQPKNFLKYLKTFSYQTKVQFSWSKICIRNKLKKNLFQVIMTLQTCLKCRFS